jgi:hypothetical protein
VISLEDMVALSGLEPDEILAIAAHEHIPEACACGIGQYLANSARGRTIIRQMIIDDIRAARAHGDRPQLLHLLHVLHHFLHRHSDARPEGHPWSKL